MLIGGTFLSDASVAQASTRVETLAILQTCGNQQKTRTLQMDAEVQDRLRGRTSLREEDEPVGGRVFRRRTSLRKEDELSSGGQVCWRRTSLREEDKSAGDECAGGRGPL